MTDISNRYPKKTIWPYLLMVFAWIGVLVILPRPWTSEEHFANSFFARMVPSSDQSSVFTHKDQLLPEQAASRELVLRDSSTAKRTVSLPVEFQERGPFYLVNRTPKNAGRPTFRLTSTTKKPKPTSESGPELIEPSAQRKLNGPKAIGRSTQTTAPDLQNPNSQTPNSGQRQKEKKNERPSAVTPDRIQLSPAELQQVQSALPEGEKIEAKPSPQLARWGRSESLYSQIEALQQLEVDAEIHGWIDHVLTHLNLLEDQELASAKSAKLLSRLLPLARSRVVQAPSVADPLVAAEVRRASYAVLRRAQVWIEINKLSRITGDDRPQQITPHHIQPRLDRLNAYLSGVDVDQQWKQYLQLDRLQEIANSPLGVEPITRQRIARDVLERMSAGRLTESQSRFLARPEFKPLKDSLSQWARAPIDASRFLASIENFELSRHQSAAIDLVDQLDSLRWQPEAADLARRMEEYYRNANVRMALTGELLDYLVPVMRPINEPVKDNFLGASVSGNNSTWTQLGLELVPDDNRIRFRLTAHGRTASNTVSKKGPVRIRTKGNARFEVGKIVSLGKKGWRSRKAIGRVRGRNRLIDIETDYDQIPILGWIVRQIAKDEHDDSQPQIDDHVQNKISESAKQRLNQEVAKRLAKAKQNVDQKIIAPLEDLEIDMKAIETRTTKKSAIVRVRFAGKHQLAAYTPRPRALRASLMSIQLHQSSINNLLQQVHLDGRKFEIEALMELLQQQFGVRPNDIHQQIPEGVSITLAHGQPLGVEFDQDRILVTIKLAELRTPRKRWRNFTVRARYKADVGRTHVRLERDGSLELISKKLGFRDQIALRGIFIKVLSANHQFQVIQGRIKEDPRLANLRITQFVAREGWIGISLGNPESLKQAMVPPTVRQAAKQSTTDSVR